MIAETSAGLYCEAGGFHIDPWLPVERAVITHAHGDHARPGSGRYLCASPGRAVLQRRLPGAHIETIPYGQPLTMADTRVSLHPAGHILGSAQVRVEHRGEVWVVSGDYKRQPDPTCDAFEPVRCHTFITEATFGLPIYTWDPPTAVVDDILAWWRDNRDADRPSVLFCYVLGKAQRILAEIGERADGPIHLHKRRALTDAYRDADIAMAHAERVPKACAARRSPDRAVRAAVGAHVDARCLTRPMRLASGLMRARCPPPARSTAASRFRTTPTGARAARHRR